MAKSKTVEIVAILDRSGTMSPIANQVISSFNEFLDSQKQEKGKAKLTLVLFDDQYEVVHDRVPLKDVKHLTSEVYYTRGMTALRDAVGKTLSSINAKTKDGIVLIQTDGLENYSKEYTQEQIKEMIDKKKEKNWDFIFIGANQDAWAVGSYMNIGATVTYTNTAAGYNNMMNTITDAVSNKRYAVATNNTDYDIMSNVRSENVVVTSDNSTGSGASSNIEIAKQ